MLTDSGKRLPTNLRKLSDGIICRLKWLFSDTIFIYLNSHFFFCDLTVFTTPTYVIEMRGCFVHNSYSDTNKLVFILKGSVSQMEVS